MTIRVAGIDPGMQTGFTHGEPGGQPVSSLIKIPDVDDYGQRFNVLEDQLRKMIIANDITDVYFEIPYVDTKTTHIKQITLLFGYQASILKACSRQGIRGVGCVSGTWRSFVYGMGRPPKGTPDASKFWKQKALEFWAQRGADITNHNVAESRCIWRYAAAQVDKTTAADSTPLFEMISL